MKKIVVCLTVLLALSSVGLAQKQFRKRGPHFGRKMAVMDKNGDGKITRDEWTRKPKAFDRLDLNHDGILTPDEVREVRQARRMRK